MDVIVTKQLTSPEVVVIAMVMVEFRNQTKETVGTIVFVCKKYCNLGNYNMNNKIININRMKIKSIITFQIYGPRVLNKL
jgi:hypothetical protein